MVFIKVSCFFACSYFLLDLAMLVSVYFDVQRYCDVYSLHSRAQERQPGWVRLYDVINDVI